MNLRSVRKKIKSVKNVKKITKAMQLMSAVKMKKAVEQEISGRPYRDSLYEIITRVSGSVDPALSPLFKSEATDASPDLVIFVSANKGLCGAFLVNILKYVLKNIDITKTEFVTIGSKGAQMLARFDRDIKADYSSANPLADASAIFDYAVETFNSKKYRKICLLYTKYISITKSEVTLTQILPIPKESFVKSEVSISKETIIEPDPKNLINSLLKSYIAEQIRGAIISSLAVEHSSRMMAMKNATDNAEDVIYSLTLVGNKIRQTKITSELLDMITAKESVESV